MILADHALAFSALCAVQWLVVHCATRFRLLSGWWLVVQHGYLLRNKKHVSVVVLVLLLYIDTAYVMRLVHSFAVSTLAPSGLQSTPLMLNVYIPPPCHARTQPA